MRELVSDTEYWVCCIDDSDNSKIECCIDSAIDYIVDTHSMEIIPVKIGPIINITLHSEKDRNKDIGIVK
jgi:hypothetical protein